MPPKKGNPLPRCVYLKHGAYYLVKKNVWTRLGATLHEALQAYAEGFKPDAHGEMATLFDRWFEHWSTDPNEKKASSTIRSYQNAINSTLKKGFSQLTPKQVRPHHIALFMDGYREAPNMANKMLVILRMVFTKAVAWGLVETNPARDIKRFKEGKRDRHIEDSEYWSIHAKADDHLKAIMDVAYTSAQRIGDVLKIVPADITEATLHVIQQKTKKEVWVAINPDLKEALERMMAFPAWSYWVTRDRWREAAEAAEVKNVKLHDLRAKGITEAERQGKDGQALAGHANRQMTERYIRDRDIVPVQGPDLRQPSKILDK